MLVVKSDNKNHLTPCCIKSMEKSEKINSFAFFKSFMEHKLVSIISLPIEVKYSFHYILTYVQRQLQFCSMSCCLATLECYVQFECPMLKQPIQVEVVSYRKLLKISPPRKYPQTEKILPKITPTQENKPIGLFIRYNIIYTCI